VLLEASVATTVYVITSVVPIDDGTIVMTPEASIDTPEMV
jgi:hypothetical protein